MKVVRLLLVVLVLFSCQIGSAQETLDRIVAIVGDNIILQSEMIQYSYSLAVQLGIDPQKEPAKLGELQKQTLEELVVQKVLLERARLDSVVVSDKQVEAVLEDQINQMIQQAGSPERVEEYFGLSVREIRREFRKDVEERLLVEALQNRKYQEIKISRREVEGFYEAYRDSLPDRKESVKIRHILMDIEPDKDAEKVALEKIEQIQDRLDKGEDFEQLAREYSEDPGSAARGGDLGLMNRGDFVKEFDEAVFTMEPGEISDVVKTQFGFHIIKLEKRMGEKVNARHILIRLDTSEGDADRAVARLAVIKEKIQRGDLTFEEAAKKYSKDETTAERGGDLGWFQVDQFQFEGFKNAVTGLNAGDISDPVKTRFGYHLVQVIERRDARELKIESDWEQIESWALDLKRRQEFASWVQDLKKDVYIEIKG